MSVGGCDEFFLPKYDGFGYIKLQNLPKSTNFTNQSGVLV